MPRRDRELAFLCGVRGNPIGSYGTTGAPDASSPIPDGSHPAVLVLQRREPYGPVRSAQTTGPGGANGGERTDGLLLGLARAWCADGGQLPGRDAGPQQRALLRGTASRGPYDIGWPAAAAENTPDLCDR